MRFSERTNWNTEESELARAHRLRRRPDCRSPTSRPQTRPAAALVTVPTCWPRSPTPMRSTTIRSPVAAWLHDRRCAVTMPGMVRPLTRATSSSPPAPAKPTVSCSACSAIPERVAGAPAQLSPFRLPCRARRRPHQSPPRWFTTRAGRSNPKDSGERSHPTTRAIVLVHPNNPTGHFTKPWEAERTGAPLPRIRPVAHRRRGLPRLWNFGYGPQFRRRARWRSRVRGQRPQQDRRLTADESGVDRGHRPGRKPRLSIAWR